MVTGQLPVSHRETYVQELCLDPTPYFLGEHEVTLHSLHEAEGRHACSLARFGDAQVLVPNSLPVYAFVGRFIFSGALVPKQIKRLLKMRGLSAVVARDAESVQAMDEALDVVSSRIE